MREQRGLSGAGYILIGRGIYTNRAADQCRNGSAAGGGGIDSGACRSPSYMSPHISPSLPISPHLCLDRGKQLERFLVMHDFMTGREIEGDVGRYMEMRGDVGSASS